MIIICSFEVCILKSLIVFVDCNPLTADCSICFQAQSSVAALQIHNMWVVAACLLTFAGAAESEVQPCERPAMLRAVRDMAPTCIEACSAICPKLNGLIMTALMGIDPTPQAWSWNLP